MRINQLLAPEVEPLTADEVRERLNIGNDVTDPVIEAFITAARQQLDGASGWLGRSLITQSWRLELDRFPYFPNREINIPLPPLQEVSSVQYIDGDGALVEMMPDEYGVFPGERPYIVPAFGTSWPTARCTPGAVAIEFTAGYGDEGENVPEPIRSAIALLVSHLRSMSAQNLFLSGETVEGIGSKSFVVGGNAGAAVDNAVRTLISGYRIISL